MVTFIPPYMGEEIKSNAEKKMYDVLPDLNIDDSYVLHSLGLPKHQSKIYGEIDFVVVCKRGIACLEIKCGRVECTEGKWIFTDRYGVAREKPEGLFAQVTGNMFSLSKILKDKFANSPHMKNALVACGVVFPDIEFKSVFQEIIPEIIYDSKTNDITDYINGVFDYWTTRQHREPSMLSKTLLAVNFASQRAAKGNKVLYLTFNKNLSKNICSQIEESWRRTQGATICCLRSWETIPWALPGGRRSFRHSCS